MLLASAAWLALGVPAQAFLESTDGAGGQNGLGAAGGDAGFGNGGGGGGNTLAGQNGSVSAGGSGGGNSINEQGGLGGTASAGGTGSTNAGNGGGVNQAGTNSLGDGGGIGGSVGQGGGGGPAQYYGGGGGGGGTGGGGGGGGTQNPLAGGGGGGFRGYYGSASSFNPVGETQILGAGGGGGGGSTGGGGGGAGVVLSEGAFTGTLQSGLTIAGGGGGGGGSTASSSGGWGGNGGTGLLLQSLDASSFTISGAVSGGNGGNGGNGGTSSPYSGGSGGAGARGIGVEGNTQTVTLIINGTVTGGNGGTAGTGFTNGSAGAGGSGIWGQNIAVTVNSTGSVSGGLGGDGVTRADALTFTGGTNTLTLETGATLTGGIVVATDATTLEFAQATDVTLSNVISGDGSISKTGAGTLLLTGANTYSGGTSVNAGTLAGTTTSLQGDIVNNASLVFDQTTNGTYSGALSGYGSLTKTGTGTVTLTASNSSYTGAVTISAGTLALSGSGSLSTASSVTVGKGTLDISATTAGATIKDLSSSDSEARVVLGSQTLSVTTLNLNTFAGVISGSGGLTVSGTLPSGLILTGENTYLGTTTVNGALAIGFNSASGSVAGDIVVNAGGGVAFARNDTYTVQNSITAAAGSLIAFAYGTYSYAGSGVISGAVLVQSGELHLIADEFANASSLSLDAGATLSGNGTVANLVVRNGGIVAPGNSPGTIAVNGTVAFKTGATYRVDVTPTREHDLLTATGAVTIEGGTVQVVTAPGDYASGIRYTIVTAASVTGTFGSVTDDYAFLDASLEYDPTNVYLTLTSNDASFASYARTPNQLSTATAAQALGDGNAIYDALLQLPENAVPAAFDALSGEAYASVSSVLQQQSIYVRDAVSGRLRQALT
ncbi:beta strand repeat-containing protein, partial [Ancylobacter polymorphus]|uniref:beta strand repeat-containing protein n=1 Tax=Ancylobacter polymorphus TaxID=223390 RepID=UPI0036419DAC